MAFRQHGPVCPMTQDDIESRLIRVEEAVKILQAIVYGVVGLTLLTVFGALFAIVLRQP